MSNIPADGRNLLGAATGTVAVESGVGMADYILRITGGKPVRFSGEIVSRVNEESKEGKFARWYEMRLYHTDSGKWVAEVVYKSNAASRDKQQREVEQSFALWDDKPEKLVEMLEGFDCQAPFPGIPVGVSGWERKDEAARQTLQDEFEFSLSKLLEGAALKEPGFARQI